MPRVFISGPMRSGVDENGQDVIPQARLDAFFEAEEMLRRVPSAAWEELGLEDGFALEIWSPARWQRHGYSRAESLRGCLMEICTLANAATVVVVLPGWEHSDGACLELRVAAALGTPVLAYPGLERLDFAGWCPASGRPGLPEEVAGWKLANLEMQVLALAAKVHKRKESNDETAGNRAGVMVNG